MRPPGVPIRGRQALVRTAAHTASPQKSCSVPRESSDPGRVKSRRSAGSRRGPQAKLKKTREDGMDRLPAGYPAGFPPLKSMTVPSGRFLLKPRKPQGSPHTFSASTAM
jgi:hypothetical protein